MKLLANENIPIRSYQLLKQKGIDILHIGLETPSISDEDVVNLSIKQHRIILTFDADYGTLVFRNKMKPPGVIYLRFNHFSPEYPAQFLLRLLHNNQYVFEGMFTVVDDEGVIRQRIISK
jgi:predicted nuclease of predicted toxin-antitoxin system